MVKLPPGQFLIPHRGVSIRGQFYSRIVNGQVVYSKWPRRQPTPRTAKEADNRKLLAVASLATKYMSSQEQAFAADMAKRAKLLPRDFLMLALFGRLGVFVGKDGRKRFSVYAVQNVSEMLDAIWQLKGGIMVRGETWWEGLPVGEAHQVLTVGDDGLLEWSDNLSPSTGLEAFQMPHLTPTLTTGLFGTGAFAGRSTWLPAGTVVNGVRVGVKTLNGAHTIRAGLYSADPTNLDMGGGTLQAESATENLALGIMSLPFASAFTVPADGWYWFGVGILGSGNPNLMAGDFTRPNEFWVTVTFPLPSTAPATTASSSVNTFWWLY